MKLIPTLLCDFYKISHREQYPDKTEEVYSTWTPRSGKYSGGLEGVVCFGIQGFVKEFIIEYFNENFFSRTKEEIVAEYSRYLKNCLFVQEPYTKHIEDLYDLGYMPLEINALDEGTIVPYRVPMMTVKNTDPRFFWLTNYLETLASNNLWKPCTVATISRKYKQILDSYAVKTTGSTLGVEFQGHDFSMRGMSGVEDSARSGVGHLLSFVGTDTIPAIMYAEQYYGADIEKELVGCSVNATEHSVMCAGGKDDEFETYRRLIEDVYPTGIVSIVSDTWDLWNVVTNTLPKLKDSIMARDGGADSIDKVVIRPDSGDPVDIMCGDPNANPNSPAFKGVVELLYDIFGGTTTDQGYKLLDSHIGAIYGDSITVERCKAICDRLKEKGFASTNVVYGIGSYTYQYITRDTLGFAMKSTSVTIHGKQNEIFKDPITDDGTKKSAKGKVVVRLDPETKELYCFDQMGELGTTDDLLTPVFKNGKLLKDATLSQIKGKLNESKN